MKAFARAALLVSILAALGAGLWLASRGTDPGRRNLDALVTLGGDAVRDAIHPAIDLTRLSSAQEANLGTAIDREVRASMQVGGDATTESYLARIAAALAAGVDRADIPYAVAVVRSPEVNAFAVAGGRIYVTEGMLAFVRSEAELAAVLGHEISHVDLRHCVERLQLERAAGKVSPVAGALARLGHEIMLRGFSEEQELAADANGAVLAARALYDPWESQALFQRFHIQESGQGRTPTRDPVAEAASVIPEALARYLATHPPADQRIEAVRRALEGNPALWKGVRRYVGRANLAARRTAGQDARAEEWIVRPAAPARNP